MKKNILHVLNIYFAIPYFLGDQLLYFKQRGYREHIICSSSDEIKECSVNLGFEYKEIPIVRKISIKDDIKAIKAIRKYIRTHNIGIVTGHTPKGALLGMIAAWLEKVPIRIYLRHGLVFETSRGIKRKLLILIEKITSKLATKIINVSPSVSQRSLEEKLDPMKKQVLLSKGTCNGIPIHKFSLENLNEVKKNNLRDKLGIQNISLVIGFSGRLVKDKGIIELIDTFRVLQQDYSNIKLLLVGMFEERDPLPIDVVDIIKKWPDIIHTKYVSYEDIEYYYSLMDIFVLPSYREGFPTSVLEASAMNLPVVTTRATGCIDSIIENKTGLFVNHNIEELVNAIRFFIENDDKKKAFGVEGRIFVEENFSSEIIWKELEKIYEK